MKRLLFCVLTVAAVCAGRSAAGNPQRPDSITSPERTGTASFGTAPANPDRPTGRVPNGDQRGGPAADDNVTDGKEESSEQSASQEEDRGPPPKVAVPSKPKKGKASRFPKEHLIKVLSGRHEKRKLGLLQTISRRYSDEPEVVGVLLEAVGKAIAENRVTQSTLLMMKMLVDHDRPEVAEAFTRWLREGVANDEFSPGLVAVIDAIGKMPRPEAVDALIAALDARDHRIVMVAAETLGRYRREKAFEAMKELVKRPEYKESYGFRVCVLEAIGRLETVESVEFLISLLPQLDGQLKFHVGQRLTQLLRLPFGGNAQRWASWWEANRNTLQLPGAVAPASQDLPWDYPLPSFYQQRIYAKNIVFVIDVSGSMRITKIVQAKSELCGAIRALPEDAKFSLISFSHKATAWRPQPTVATAENKAAAVEDVARLRAHGSTNIYPAIDMAFAMDPNTEVICVLSDGSSRFKEVANAAELLQVVARANRFRRITINTICLDAPNELMQGLAAPNGGTYRVIPSPLAVQ